MRSNYQPLTEKPQSTPVPEENCDSIPVHRLQNKTTWPLSRLISSLLRRFRPGTSWFPVIPTVQQKCPPLNRCGWCDAYKITPLLHYSTTPLLHYSITPLLHYPDTPIPRPTVVAASPRCTLPWLRIRVDEPCRDAVRVFPENAFTLLACYQSNAFVIAGQKP